MPGSRRGGIYKKSRESPAQMQVKSKTMPKSSQALDKRTVKPNDIIHKLTTIIATRTIVAAKTETIKPDSKNQIDKEKKTMAEEETQQQDTEDINSKPMSAEEDDFASLFFRGAKKLQTQMNQKMENVGVQADNKLADLVNKFGDMEHQAEEKMKSIDNIIDKRFEGQDKTIEALKIELEKTISSQLDNATSRIENIEDELLIEEVGKLQDAQNKAEENGIVASTRLGSMQAEIDALKKRADETEKWRNLRDSQIDEVIVALRSAADLLEGKKIKKLQPAEQTQPDAKEQDKSKEKQV